MADLKLSAIFPGAVCIVLPSRVRVIPRFELSDESQRCAIIHDGGNRRSVPADEET